MKSLWKLALLVLLLPAALVARQPAQAQSQLERGEYLAIVAGCTTCHTPYKPEYGDLSALTLDQMKTLAFSENNAVDNSRLLAGGRRFELGPAGFVVTANISPDAATGIGAWTDDQVRTAIRSGVNPSGRVLFPIMPYHSFNSMADADLDAIIAFLRAAAPVANAVDRSQVVDTTGMQSIPFRQGISAPDPADQLAYGEYLVKSVLACTDCHTPLDPQTGAPMMDKFLGGGQPYEGPWGIVYGGNITADAETGLGDWTVEQLKTALVTGVRPDGRRLILMPWYVYGQLTDADATAVAVYLKEGLPPVNNPVPANAIQPDFIQNVETAPSAQPANNTALLLGLALVVVLLAAGGFFLWRKRQA